MGVHASAKLREKWPGKRRVDVDVRTLNYCAISGDKGGGQRRGSDVHSAASAAIGKGEQRCKPRKTGGRGGGKKNSRRCDEIWGKLSH